jgi:hypothetical protein
MPVRPKFLAVALLGLTYVVAHRAGQVAGFNLATRRFIRLAREVERAADE